MSEPLELRLGVKTDPIEYRYSHRWLFEILADENVTQVQIGTHFEMYQLPDEFFHELKREAENAGVEIASMFTAHRELGGFFREEPGYEQVARKNFERYIEIGGILGAKSIGSNPGAVMRDRMGYKPQGIECYLKHMKELMHFATEQGVEWLTIEPMSCLAEPPTLPAEIAHMGEMLTSYHNENKESTAQVGFCTDIAHGYADHQGATQFDHIQLFEAAYPWLYEIHLKNTDPQFNSTFGFSPADLERGIVDVAHFRNLLLQNADKLPVKEMTGYLEIGGPKLGRDYSDHQLEQSLRESLQHLKKTFLQESQDGSSPAVAATTTATNGAIAKPAGEVLIAPSMMCVDPLNFESALRRVEALGVDMLHMDVMDGHFVPNAPMGLAVVEETCKRSHLPVDVHLMVEDNDFFVELMADWNVHQISVHCESSIHLDRTLARVRETGALAGIAINPATPLSVIEYLLERIDYVLIMTVNPGYAGQKMTPASIRKIADCRQMLDDRGLSHIPIQVDGNVSFENIPPMVAAGGANLVAGTSSIFSKAGSEKENIAAMREGISVGLAQAK